MSTRVRQAVDETRDMETLGRLLGEGRRQYLGLRHEGLLNVPAPGRRRRYPRIWNVPAWAAAAAAAAVLLFVAVRQIGVPTLEQALGRSQLAIQRPDGMPLSLRPSGRLSGWMRAPRPVTAGRKPSLSLPKRPTALSG